MPWQLSLHPGWCPCGETLRSPRTILLVTIEISIQSSPSRSLVFPARSSKPLSQTQRFFSLSLDISGAFLQLFEVHSFLGLHHVFYMLYILICTLLSLWRLCVYIPQGDGFQVPDLTKPNLHAALEALGLSQCHSKDRWENLVPAGPTESS